MRSSKENLRRIVCKSILTEIPVIIDSIINQMLQKLNQVISIGKTARSVADLVRLRTHMRRTLVAYCTTLLGR